MRALVLGAAASGKSEFAEGLCVQAAQGIGAPLVYVATMQAQGEAAATRIRRHRALREGKGFTTLECTTDLGQAAACVPRGSVVLLEDLGNLLANVLFEVDSGLVPKPAASGIPQSLRQSCFGEGPTGAFASCGTRFVGYTGGHGIAEGLCELGTKGASRILEGVEALAQLSSTLVVVTPDVGRDGLSYPAETERYRTALAAVNASLAERFDVACEVVCGIPLYLKGGRQ